jgi:mRNA interferase MazF
MAAGSWIEPDAGDIVWIDYSPPVGHEQAGRRPSIVLSPRLYNAKSSLLILCPITRNDRPWPFKVPIPPVGEIRGFVLVDHVRSVDPRARYYRYVGRIPDDVLDDVRASLIELLELHGAWFGSGIA